MRYTRNRQLRKINSVMESTWCLTIEDSKRYVWSDKLDKSFKWHREGNNHVEFKMLSGTLKSTVFLPVKWNSYK